MSLFPRGSIFESHNNVLHCKQKPAASLIRTRETRSCVRCGSCHLVVAVATWNAFLKWKSRWLWRCQKSPDSRWGTSRNGPTVSLPFPSSYKLHDSDVGKKTWRIRIHDRLLNIPSSIRSGVAHFAPLCIIKRDHFTTRCLTRLKCRSMENTAFPQSDSKIKASFLIPENFTYMPEEKEARNRRIARVSADEPRFRFRCASLRAK